MYIPNEIFVVINRFLINECKYLNKNINKYITDDETSHKGYWFRMSGIEDIFSRSDINWKMIYMMKNNKIKRINNNQYNVDKLCKFKNRDERACYRATHLNDSEECNRWEILPWFSRLFHYNYGKYDRTILSSNILDKNFEPNYRTDNEYLLLKRLGLDYEDKDIVDLAGFKLDSIPEEIKYFDIIQFNLNHNNITNSGLDNLYWHILDLKILNLNDNNLTYFPEQLFMLNIYCLDLSCNKIETIPSEISKMKNLIQFGIAHNEIKILPPELFNLDLEYLDISTNNIEVLPNEITNLEHLRILIIKNNKISNIMMLGNMKNFILEVLFFNDNPISDLPDCCIWNVDIGRLGGFGTNINQYSNASNFCLSCNY